MIRYMILTNHFTSILPLLLIGHIPHKFIRDVLPEQLRFSLGEQIIFNYYNNRILGELLYNYLREKSKALSLVSHSTYKQNTMVKTSCFSRAPLLH